MDLPTHSEMDDVHKTLHELKREVRQLSAGWPHPRGAPCRTSPDRCRGNGSRNSTRRAACDTARVGIGRMENTRFSLTVDLLSSESVCNSLSC